MDPRKPTRSDDIWMCFDILNSQHTNAAFKSFALNLSVEPICANLAVMLLRSKKVHFLLKGSINRDSNLGRVSAIKTQWSDPVNTVETKLS